MSGSQSSISDVEAKRSCCKSAGGHVALPLKMCTTLVLMLLAECNLNFPEFDKND